MDSVKEWQLINNNCDDVAFKLAGSPKSFATCLQILNQRCLPSLCSLINFFFSPSARRCTSSHLVGSFQFRASVVNQLLLTMASPGWPCWGKAAGERQTSARQRVVWSCGSGVRAQGRFLLELNPAGTLYRMNQRP
jgi:hypothetical protein